MPPKAVPTSKPTSGVCPNCGRNVIGRKEGPSGKPMLHFIQHSTRKQAEDAARDAGKGNPPLAHPPHGPGQNPHYHPTTKDGSIRKDGSHHEFPKGK
jgi:hypothetical protein